MSSLTKSYTNCNITDGQWLEFTTYFEANFPNPTYLTERQNEFVMSNILNKEGDSFCEHNTKWLHTFRDFLSECLPFENLGSYKSVDNKPVEQRLSEILKPAAVRAMELFKVFKCLTFVLENK